MGEIAEASREYVLAARKLDKSDHPEKQAYMAAYRLLERIGATIPEEHQDFVERHHERVLKHIEGKEPKEKISRIRRAKYIQYKPQWIKARSNIMYFRQLMAEGKKCKPARLIAGVSTGFADLSKWHYDAQLKNDPETIEKVKKAILSGQNLQQIARSLDINVLTVGDIIYLSPLFDELTA